MSDEGRVSCANIGLTCQHSPLSSLVTISTNHWTAASACGLIQLNDLSPCGDGLLEENSEGRGRATLKKLSANLCGVFCSVSFPSSRNTMNPHFSLVLFICKQISSIHKSQVVYSLDKRLFPPLCYCSMGKYIYLFSLHLYQPLGMVERSLL